MQLTSEHYTRPFSSSLEKGRFIFALLFGFLLTISCNESNNEQKNPISEQILAFQLADSLVLTYPLGKYSLPLLTAGYPFFLHDNIYYVNFGSGIISLFDLKGNLVRELGGIGNAPGNLFGRPTLLALPKKQILAYDAMRQKVVKFDSTGNFISEGYLLKEKHPRESHAQLRNLSTVSPGFAYKDELFFPTYGLGVSLRHRPEMYQHPIMSVFDQNYLLLSSFGNYDKVYLHNDGTLPYACETLAALNRAKNEIVVTFSATARLYIYDATRKQLKYVLVPPQALTAQLKQNFVYLTHDGTPPDGRKLSIFFNLFTSPNGRLTLSTVENANIGNGFVAYDHEYHYLGIFPFPLADAQVICHVDDYFIYFLGTYNEVKASRTIYRYRYTLK
jgi:hypothetical protein